MSRWMTAGCKCKCPVGTLINVIVNDKDIMKQWKTAIAKAGKSWQDFVKEGEKQRVGTKDCSLVFKNPDGYHDVGFYQENGEWHITAYDPLDRNLKTESGFDLAKAIGAKVKAKQMSDLLTKMGGKLKQTQVGGKIIITADDVDDAALKQLLGIAGSGNASKARA